MISSQYATKQQYVTSVTPVVAYTEPNMKDAYVFHSEQLGEDGCQPAEKQPVRLSNTEDTLYQGRPSIYCEIYRGERMFKLVVVWCSMCVNILSFRWSQ